MPVGAGQTADHYARRRRSWSMRWDRKGTAVEKIDYRRVAQDACVGSPEQVVIDEQRGNGRCGAGDGRHEHRIVVLQPATHAGDPVATALQSPEVIRRRCAPSTGDPPAHALVVEVAVTLEQLAMHVVSFHRRDTARAVDFVQLAELSQRRIDQSDARARQPIEHASEVLRDMIIQRIEH